MPVISGFCENIEPQAAANPTVMTLAVIFVIVACSAKTAESDCVKYWEIIADNLSKAGWSWGCSSETDSTGRVIFTADAYSRDGRRFIVLANERLTAFLELQAAIRRQLELG